MLNSIFVIVFYVYTNHNLKNIQISKKISPKNKKYENDN